MLAPERDALLYPGFTDGVDVSSANAMPDWKRVYAAGFRFAYVKGAEGVRGRDPKYRDYLKGAEDAGLLAGEYLFLRPSQGDARAQVQNAYDAAGSVFPGRLCLDAENGPDDWSGDQLIAFYEECVDECLRWSVMSPVMYLFPWWALHRLMPALGRSGLGRCELWMADYGGRQPWIPPRGYRPVVPVPFTNWAIHQYGGNGGFRVPGMPGDTDRDLFNGDVDALRAFFGLPPKTTSADEPTRIISPPVDFPPRDYSGADGESDTLPVPYSRPPVVIVDDAPKDEPPPRAA